MLVVELNLTFVFLPSTKLTLYVTYVFPASPELISAGVCLITALVPLPSSKSTISLRFTPCSSWEERTLAVVLPLTIHWWSASIWVTAYNCEPLIASVELLLIRPAATFTNWRSWPEEPKLTTLSGFPPAKIYVFLKKSCDALGIAVLVTEPEPRATAFLSDAIAPRPSAVAFKAVTFASVPIAMLSSVDADDLWPTAIDFLPEALAPFLSFSDGVPSIEPPIATAFSPEAFEDAPPANEPKPLACDNTPIAVARWAVDAA